MFFNQDSMLLRLIAMKAALNAAVTEDTATGNPLTFTTDLAKPLKSLLIPFTPLQPGSGDPSPENVRPISGWTGVNVVHCGKNLFDFSLVENGDIASNGVYGGISNSRLVNKTFIKLAPGTYTISNESGFPVAIYAYTAEDENSFLSAESKVGWNSTPVTFTFTNARYVRFKWKNNEGTNLTPSSLVGLQLEHGSSATPYESYNGTVYPVVFPAMGKNLFDKSKVTTGVWWKGRILTGGTYDNYSASDYIPVKAGQAYVLTREVSGQGAVCYFDESKTYITQETWDNYTPSRVIPSGVAFVCFTMLTTGLDTAQFEKGQTATAYEPFTNTVYGGTLDVVSGVLTVEYGFTTLDDSVPVGLANWRPTEGTSAWLYSPMVIPSDTATNSAICDKVKQYGYGSIYNGSVGIATNIVSGDYGLAIRIPVENLSTEEAIHAYLAENPYHVAYKLATPQEIQLTPQQITALVGVNTIWSDTNGSNAATYLKKG